MPKELVRASDNPYGGKWDKGDGEIVDVFVPIASVVDVRWDRESGYFQMATHTIDAVTGGYVMEYPKELRDAYGPTICLPIEESTPEQREAARLAYEREWVACQQGQYVGLDRRGINDLIRILRRARDAAFGRDE